MVHVDVLILQNFIVNFFLLQVAAQCLRFRTRYSHTISAALIGAFYVLTMVFKELAILSAIPFQILVAGIMVSLAFRKRDLKFLVKGTAVLILESMLLSGLCMYLQVSGMKGLRSIISSLDIMEDFSYKEVLLSAMLLYILIYRIVVYIKDRKDITLYTYTVDIIVNNQSTQVRAFLDTGNELREPVTNLPVMIVEKDVLQEITLREEDKLYIPYRVINGQSGRLQGFKPSFVRIHYGEARTEARNVIVGFCENQLSENGDYKALLSRGII